MNREEFEYMKEALTTDLAELLVNNYHMSAIEALDVLYASDTYAKLRDPQTGLYFQSSSIRCWRMNLQQVPWDNFCISLSFKISVRGIRRRE